jgi:hypothetical protein
MALPRIFQVRSLKLAAVAVGLAAMGGCATVPEQSPEQIVKARAQARWDALVKGDYATAYSYLGPGSRAVNSLEAYKDSIVKGFYKDGQVEKAVCDSPERCEAHVRVEYEFKGKRMKSPLAETWIRQQGNWWYVLK